MKSFDKIALTIVIIGALNWLLVALGANLVEMITFGLDFLAKTIYFVVGLSGLYCIKLLH
jgi:hypothetical protein